MKKKVEVYVLSGFLGSGKTTLLKQIIEAEKEAGRQIAVIMNELGKISIDSDQVPKDTPLSELYDGCICCTIQDKLESTFQELLLKDLDAIYIETTGAAHPIEVIDTIHSPIFANKIELASCITLLDVFSWKNRNKFSIQIQQLLKEQLKHADLILINKTDLLSESEVSTIVFEIQQINNNAKYILTTFAKIPPNSWKGLENVERKSHQSLHVQKKLNLRTFVYQFTNEIDLDEFESWVRNLPDNIYRIKGYVKFEHTSSIYLFQYSYGTPLYIKEIVKVPLNLVLIGENLDIEKLTEGLNNLEYKK